LTQRYGASALTARCRRKETNPGWAMKYRLVFSHIARNASSRSGRTTKLLIRVTEPVGRPTVADAVRPSAVMSSMVISSSVGALACIRCTTVH